MRPLEDFLKPMALCLAVAMACWFLSVATPLHWLSVRMTDGLLRSAPLPPSRHFLLIAIDDATVQALGRFPFDRQVYGRMLNRLHQAGAKVVAFDLLFLEPSPSDAAMAEAMKRFGKVVLGVGVVFNRPKPPAPLPKRFLLPFAPFARHLRPSDLLPAPALVLPPRPLREACAAVGFVFPFPDPDGVCRRLPQILRWRNTRQVVPSLTLAAWTLWAGKEKVKEVAPLLVSDGSVWVTPPDVDGSVRFPTLSLVRVLQGDFHPDWVKGKILLVGLMASGLTDRLPTPTNPIASGLEIHAAALNVLLQRRGVTVASELFQGVFLLAIGVVFGLVGATKNPRRYLYALAGTAAISISSSVLLMHWWRFALPPFPPLLTVWSCWTVLTAWALSEHRRAYEQLSAYIAYPALDELARTPEHLIAGERREISVLFSDIRGFTRLSASLAPYEVVTLLGTYFTRMTEIVNLYGGTVNKFLGDGMMALFGLGENQFDHAERAVICACHMLEEVESLQNEWQRVTGEPLRIGIGVHSGIAVVGVIGSEQRKEFTALGATVNLAQRLEQLTKEVKANLVISEDTYERVADLVIAEPVSGVVIKGYEETPMTVYRVHGLTDEMRRLRSQFWVTASP
jgi:adenylate cyclase